MLRVEPPSSFYGTKNIGDPTNNDPIYTTV